MRTVSLHIRRRLKGRLQVVDNALPMFQMRYIRKQGCGGARKIQTAGRKRSTEQQVLTERAHMYVL